MIFDEYLHLDNIKRKHFYTMLDYVYDEEEDIRIYYYHMELVLEVCKVELRVLFYYIMEYNIEQDTYYTIKPHTYPCMIFLNNRVLYDQLGYKDYYYFDTLNIIED